MDHLVSSVVPGNAAGSVQLLTGIWARTRSFLLHITMVVLVGLFMRFYVDGRVFFLSHDLALRQADGSIIHERVASPVQRDVTMIISILASTARAAGALWLAGIDLRCIFLFMKRGGVTLAGLQSMFGRSLPGRRHFRQRTNFIILVLLHVGIFASTYTTSILAGSVTWNPAVLYRPGKLVTGIPLGQTGDRVLSTALPALTDAFVAYSTSIYSIFYSGEVNRDSVSMHRLVPDPVRSLPNGSRFDNLTVPYFVVDDFQWIKDPNSTLTPRQLLNATITANTTGPRVMTINKWGLIPDGNWGPFQRNFTAPLTVSESRILVIWTGRQISSECKLDSTVPSDVQPYMAPFNGLLSCFIFAHVTYRAGAAHSRRSQVSGTGVITDVGDVKDLQLVDDPVTSVALSIAPYVGTTLIQTGYALPLPPAFPTLEKQTIETLSRSYQVAWNGLTSEYGAVATESSNVMIAVDASIASVLMWRVAVWGTLHGILVVFGFVFRHLHKPGLYPWIEDPVTAALLVDPSSLMNDKRTWSGRDAPHIAGRLKLEQDGTSTYLVLTEKEEEEEEKGENRV